MRQGNARLDFPNLPWVSSSSRVSPLRADDKCFGECSHIEPLSHANRRSFWRPICSQDSLAHPYNSKLQHGRIFDNFPLIVEIIHKTIHFFSERLFSLVSVKEIRFPKVISNFAVVLGITTSLFCSSARLFSNPHKKVTSFPISCILPLAVWRFEILK